MEDKCLSQLKEVKCLPEGDLKQLCQKAKEIFLEESNPICECSSNNIWRFSWPNI